VATFAGSRNLAFVIRSSKIQGKGAFATRRIRKGERIIEYLGECIDADESDIRYPDGEMGRHHTFLFSIGDGTRVLDAGPLEWPAKYVNHSCDPNTEAIEEEDGRVFVHALRAIEQDQELLYDYAYERTPEHTEEDEQLYKCLCGSPKCRGSILALPKPKKVKKGKAKKAKKDKDKKDKDKKDKDKKDKDKKDKDKKYEKDENKKGSNSKRQRTAQDVAAKQASSTHTAAGATLPVPVTSTRKPGTKGASTGEPRGSGRPANTTGVKTSKRKLGVGGGSVRVSKTVRNSLSKRAGTRKVAGGTKRPGRQAAR